MNDVPHCKQSEKARLPLWIKAGLLLFVLIFLPASWRQYGPAAWLWLCHVALLLALTAAWLESAWLASLATVGVLIIQLLWLGGLLRGLVGLGVSDPMQYMFDSRIPLYMRGLSLFHGWMPFLLLFMLKRLGYDRRALLAYTPIAGIVFVLSYFFSLPPPAPESDPLLAVNVNFVHGLRSDVPQSLMAHGWWLALVMVGSWVLLFLPAHLALARLFRPPPHHGKEP